jgi:cobalamin biosynthesis Mg chelatase CobN
LAADKKAGIKWVRLEPRSKTSIESYLKLASTEYERIKAYDPAAVRAQAAQLVEVDKAIASGDYDVAGQKLTAASGLSGQKADTKSKTKSKSKTSYITHLRTKLTEQVAAKTAAAKAAADAAKSEALTAGLIKQQESNSPEIKVATEPAADGSTPAPAEAAPVTAGDLFSALSTNQAAKPAAETAPPKKPTKPSGSASPAKPKPSAKDETAEDEDEEAIERPRSAPVEEESGGFSFGLVVPILTVVLILAIVLLKVLGIGGKKSDD